MEWSHRPWMLGLYPRLFYFKVCCSVKASDEYVQGARQGVERARAEVQEKEERRHVLHQAHPYFSQVLPC